MAHALVCSRMRCRCFPWSGSRRVIARGPVCGLTAAAAPEAFDSGVAVEALILPWRPPPAFNVQPPRSRRCSSAPGFQPALLLAVALVTCVPC